MVLSLVSGDLCPGGKAALTGVGYAPDNRAKSWRYEVYAGKCLGNLCSVQFVLPWAYEKELDTVAGHLFLKVH